MRPCASAPASKSGGSRRRKKTSAVAGRGSLASSAASPASTVWRPSAVRSTRFHQPGRVESQVRMPAAKAASATTRATSRPIESRVQVPVPRLTATSASRAGAWRGTRRRRSRRRRRPPRACRARPSVNEPWSCETTLRCTSTPRSQWSGSSCPMRAKCGRKKIRSRLTTKDEEAGDERRRGRRADRQADGAEEARGQHRAQVAGPDRGPVGAAGGLRAEPLHRQRVERHRAPQDGHEGRRRAELAEHDGRVAHGRGQQELEQPALGLLADHAHRDQRRQQRQQVPVVVGDAERDHQRLIDVAAQGGDDQVAGVGAEEGERDHQQHPGQRAQEEPGELAAVDVEDAAHAPPSRARPAGGGSIDGGDGGAGALRRRLQRRPEVAPRALLEGIQVVDRLLRRRRHPGEPAPAPGRRARARRARPRAPPGSRGGDGAAAGGTAAPRSPSAMRANSSSSVGRRKESSRSAQPRWAASAPMSSRRSLSQSTSNWWWMPNRPRSRTSPAPAIAREQPPRLGRIAHDGFDAHVARLAEAGARAPRAGRRRRSRPRGA